MDLKTLLKNLSDQSEQVLAAFASRCDTSVGHLRNIGYGYKPCAPALAVSIEQASDGAVRRWDLRPTDWHRIWPELKGAEGAPEPEEIVPDPAASAERQQAA
jgi:DNA-binding transcriptional regulator YdaS (Cro superfamily)